jgi:NAD(P)-dependent dehydrogenase (short-subunit alcohol dehydrogenase family)
VKSAVLITGAAGGLGTAVTRHFLSLEIPVIAMIGLKDDPAFLTHDLLTVFPADLTSEEQSRTIFHKALEQSGPVSMGIFLVGGFAMGNLESTGLDGIRPMFRLNFETAYISARLMFNYFRNQGVPGRMVFIGSRPGLDPGQASEFVAYGLSKSLVSSLVELINGTGKNEQIDAALIAPSVIDTPGNRKAMPNADYSKWVKPGQIAEAIHFLYSDAGRKLKNPVLKIYGDS